MLKVDNIYKQYEGNPLIRGVSFVVDQNETVCLLGASGSGKSTILRIIAGLEKPESGKIYWNNQELTHVPVHKRKFGLMFQEFALFPHKNVEENVSFGLKMNDMPQTERKHKTYEALKRVHMSSFAKRNVTDLSGGEKQRIALARTLASDPKLLMLDEPLGALDKTLRESLLLELRELIRNSGIPAIYVTHDQEEAYSIADHLILIKDGKIEQEGSPEKIFYNPKSKWVANFLGLKNIIEGDYTSKNPYIIETKIGNIYCDNIADTIALGSRVNVLIHANAVAVSTEKKANNQISGIVRDIVFSGGVYHIVFNTLNSNIDLFFDINTPLKIGEQITIELSSPQVICISE